MTYRLVDIYHFYFRRIVFPYDPRRSTYDPRSVGRTWIDSFNGTLVHVCTISFSLFNLKLTSSFLMISGGKPSNFRLYSLNIKSDIWRQSLFTFVFVYEIPCAKSTLPNSWRYRSSYRRGSLKKVVLKNFAKFTGKYLRRSLFFIRGLTEHLRATASW